MPENKRFLIALGLMETDLAKIKDDKVFKQSSKTRMDVASKVEGAILAYCMHSGIYSRFNGFNRVKVPVNLCIDQLCPEVKSDLYAPWEFNGTPMGFIQAALDYKHQCKELEEKYMGLKDFFTTSPYGNRFLKQRIEGPGVPLLINGVVGSEKQINELNLVIKRLFNHLKYAEFGNPSFERHIVAQVKY